LTSRIASPAATATLLFTVLLSACGESSPGTTTPPPTVALPVIASFSATPNRITSDQTTTLAWSVTGAQSVSIDHGVGTVTGSSRVVTPISTRTYTLTATNSAGASTTATAVVTVTGGVAGITLTWNAGSSVKLEQVIGDKDWSAWATGTTLPTTNQTATRYNILGTDIGTSFEDNGKLMVFFGDVLPATSSPTFGAPDPLASSSTTDGESPLALTFVTRSDGTPLFVRMQGIDMGANNVPNAGVSLSDGIYLVINTGATVADGQANAKSMLVRYDPAAGTFPAGRTISQMPAGKFVFTALRASGSDVYMFGTGVYRGSDIYLSVTPAASFAAGTGTKYYAGHVNGQPTWSTSESGAVPIIKDNPLNSATYSPTVGNVSVGYSADLGLWLMTFDGGRQSQQTGGFYFTYAKELTGPWTTPQLIFNPTRDNAFTKYIHNPAASPNDGLNGPTIGPNDPTTTPGGPYAPMLLDRFTKVNGNTLRIYYFNSTWNPYTVVKMRSEFTIGHP
jgi:hypothetical protein